MAKTVPEKGERKAKKKKKYQSPKLTMYSDIKKIKGY